MSSPDYGSTHADKSPKTPTNVSRTDPQPDGTPSTVVGFDVVACATASNSYPLLFRASPARLLLRDLLFLIRHAALLPWIFLPITSISDIKPIGIIAQIVFLIGSLIVTAAILATLSIGFPPFLISLVLLVVFVYLSQAVQGKRLRHSKSPAIVPNAHKEAWFLLVSKVLANTSINGICTTGTGAQANIDRLHELFHRPVTAILNRSFGLWFDLLECIIQRDLLYITSDIREGYAPLRKAILDPSKERIVVIAHSQGGIIATAWVDQLICDCSTELLGRVEVYTFASAANHFSRPANQLNGNGQPFRHVEHFANEGDFVAQFGVLGNAPGPNEPNEGDTHKPRDELISAKLDAAHDLPITVGDYAGRIFCRRHHTGHLLNAHYLNPNYCILDDKFVRQHSRLVQYLDGGEALE